MARKPKASGRKTERSRSRKGNRIPKRYAFLIVHEGEETEREYFKSWRGKGLSITPEPIVGPPEIIINEAIRLRALKAYDEVWVVFDLDHDSGRGGEQYEAFAKAIRSAGKERIDVAYSIDAFEVWFRLHYEMITGPVHRNQLYADLSKRWNIKYDPDGKRRGFAKTIKALLDEDNSASVGKAIARAKKLYKERQELPYEEQNPITTVYRLIERFLEVLEDNG